MGASHLDKMRTDWAVTIQLFESLSATPLRILLFAAFHSTMQHAQRSTTQYNWFNSCNLIRYKTRQYTTAQHNTTQCFQDIIMVCHHGLSPLSCRTSLIRVHVYASMQRFRDFEEANPLSLPSMPSGTSLRLESALVQRRLKASPRWHSKGWFFCFLERNSNFWSPQHDWKTKIIWNWSPTYSNSHDLSRFSALPVTWAEERPHDQGRMVQPLYSSANQVAQTRAAGYLESTRLAGQGEELDVFLLFFCWSCGQIFVYTDTWAVHKNNWLLFVVKGVIVILLLVADIVIANYR